MDLSGEFVKTSRSVKTAKLFSVILQVPIQLPQILQHNSQPSLHSEGKEVLSITMTVTLKGPNLNHNHTIWCWTKDASAGINSVNILETL